MSGTGHETSSGDSTPDLEFLREHDDGSRTKWPNDPDHDSATDMLPPEEESPEPPPDQAGGEVFRPAENENGSSIHRPPDAPPGAWPDSTVVSERVESMPPAEPCKTDSDDSVFDGVMDTMSQVAHAIDGEPSSVSVSTSRAGPTVSGPPRKNNLLLVALASYASAVTIALLYLVLHRATAPPSQLESLPDVAPLKEDEVMRRVPVDAEMPPGHTLTLGESRRFGNILIEPLRVVREPLAFVHFSGLDDQSMPESEPVLKLWVRFTNESRDQSIAPLDGELLFTRAYRPETGETWANQFVCSLDTKHAAGEPVLVYDFPPAAEFDMVDQQLGRVLQPGASYETFIPSAEDGLDGLTDELVWRVHFRKGYSPKGYGVTTVVEVRFDGTDIASKSAAS